MSLSGEILDKQHRGSQSAEEKTLQLEDKEIPAQKKVKLVLSWNSDG